MTPRSRSPTWPSIKLFELGQSVPRRRDLREAALPYLQDRYESDAGLARKTPRTIVAPVYDSRRTLLAAISITGSAERLDLDRLAPAVRTAASALSRELAGGR